MQELLRTTDDTGLFSDRSEVLPHISITLTPEQMAVIGDKIPSIATIDGYSLIPIKNDNREFTGEKIFTVVFKNA